MVAASRPREFLYVDVQRTRSLLSQLGGGLVEQVKALSADTLQGQAQARILGIGGSGSYSRDTRAEESRSLQDMAFAMLEDQADEAGIIVDAPDWLFDPEQWESSSVHERLRPSQILRITCEVQLLDGGLFRTRMERFVALTEALARLSPAESTGPSGPKQKAEAVRKAQLAIMQGSTPDQIDAICGVVDSMLGDTIALRSLPCGSEHLEFSFSGALLGRKEYIQEEREALLSRYGGFNQEWTSVFQVASVPRSEDKVVDLTNNDFLLADGQVSRARTERGVIELSAIFEGIGFIDGPRWPTVSVTPLALYREVPYAADLQE